MWCLIHYFGRMLLVSGSCMKSLAVGLSLLSGILYPVVRYLLHHYLVHDFLRF